MMRLLTALILALAAVPIAHAQAKPTRAAGHVRPTYVGISYLQLTGTAPGLPHYAAIVSNAKPIIDNIPVNDSATLLDQSVLSTTVRMHQLSAGTMELSFYVSQNAHGKVINTTLHRRLTFGVKTFVGIIQVGSHPISLVARVSHSSNPNIFNLPALNADRPHHRPYPNWKITPLTASRLSS